MNPPRTRIKTALRAALRRRYGYAALRVLRRGARAAFAAHRAAQLGVAPYAGDGRELATFYRAALRRLLRVFPSLAFDDERAVP